MHAYFVFVGRQKRHVLLVKVQYNDNIEIHKSVDDIVGIDYIY